MICRGLDRDKVHCVHLPVLGVFPIIHSPFPYLGVPNEMATSASKLSKIPPKDSHPPNRAQAHIRAPTSSRLQTTQFVQRWRWVTTLYQPRKMVLSALGMGL